MGNAMTPVDIERDCGGGGTARIAALCGVSVCDRGRLLDCLFNHQRMVGKTDQFRQMRIVVKG